MKKIKNKIRKHLGDFAVGAIVVFLTLAVVVSVTAHTVTGLIVTAVNRTQIKPKPSPSRRPVPTGDLIENETNQTQTITIKGGHYTVKEGDSLWEIALAAYGDGMMMYRIMNANNIANPDQIETGMVLKLPR